MTEALDGQAVTQRCQAACSRISNDGKLALDTEGYEGKPSNDSLVHVLAQTRDDGRKDCQAVDDLLSFLIRRLHGCIGRLGACTCSENLVLETSLDVTLLTPKGRLQGFRHARPEFRNPFNKILPELSRKLRERELGTPSDEASLYDFF
jgi:hypothetical protein